MLDLNELAAGEHPGIIAEKGADLAQAGAVCLEERGHHQGVALVVRGDIRNAYQLFWTPSTAQARRTWNDEKEATEHAAAGIAALLADREIGYAAILRSRQGTGFDYLLGDDDTLNVSDIEQEATMAFGAFLEDTNLVARVRLEVSGIRKGNDSTIRRRVRKKLIQTGPSDNLRIPAYAVVVEFGTPLAEIRRKNNAVR